MEKILLCKYEKINEDVIFEPKECSHSPGITLKSFNLDDDLMTVKNIIDYGLWGVGKINPGSCQRGTYLLNDERGREYYAAIRDERDIAGNHKIVLLGIANSQKELEKQLTASTLEQLTKAQ